MYDSLDKISLITVFILLQALLIKNIIFYNLIVFCPYVKYLNYFKINFCEKVKLLNL